MPTLSDIFQKAINDYNGKKYEESKIAFLQLINSNVEIARCHYYLGIINAKTNNFDEAQRHFLKNIELDSNNYQAIYFTGEMYEKKGNKDLALYYYSKTLEIHPEHANAKKSIQRLGKSNTPNSLNPPTSDKEPVNIESVSEQDDEPYVGDLYDQLKEAKDAFSKAAVKMIKATKFINIRPRISSYFGVLLFILIVLPTVLFLFLEFMDSFERRSHKFWVEDFFAKGSIMIFLFFLYKLIEIKSKIVTIDRGFIKITKGLLTRSTKIYNIHTATSYEATQGFLNILTGDGTLRFVDPQSANTQIGTNIKIKGLARYKELIQLVENLRSLHYQLRSTNVIKSGIFG